MKCPVKSLRKKDLEWLGTNKCKAHGHTYLVHYNCFLKEKPATSPFYEKIGFLDIEASNLHADFGYIFSYAIKEEDGPILGRVLKPKEIKSFLFDKKLMEEFVVDVKKFHRIVVHWGVDRKFDLPFLRTRCLKYDIDFPLYKDIYVEDTCSMSQAKLRLSRNRLENICDFFGIPSKGHKMEPTMWQKALSGHNKSLQYIWKHNLEDVESLEAVWKKLHPYVLRGKRSI